VRENWQTIDTVERDVDVVLIDVVVETMLDVVDGGAGVVVKLVVVLLVKVVGAVLVVSVVVLVVVGSTFVIFINKHPLTFEKSSKIILVCNNDEECERRDRAHFVFVTWTNAGHVVAHALRTIDTIIIVGDTRTNSAATTAAFAAFAPSFHANRPKDASRTVCAN
jgi:hypothetical protein